MSSTFLLTFLSCGNACFVCLPNWHASQIFCIPSTLNFGSPVTSSLVCIDLNLCTLACPTLLCQMSMSATTPAPCANIAAFISGMFTSNVNIRPHLLPFVINLHLSLKSSTKTPSWLNRTCKPCSTIWPTETRFFVIFGT